VLLFGRSIAGTGLADHIGYTPAIAVGDGQSRELVLLVPERLGTWFKFDRNFRQEVLLVFPYNRNQR
jgi:hypothetical protein